MDINVIDIEASGLHADSYPIEIAVMVGGKCRSWLIKPEPNWQHWDVFAEALHGIPRELLLREGLSARMVAQELNEFMSQTQSALHSDAFLWDRSWIDTLYQCVNLERTFKLESIFDLLDERQAQTFQREKAQVAERTRFRRHRAAGDVEIIRQAYSTVLATTAVY